MDYFIVELAQQEKLAIPLTQVQEVISIDGNDICPIPGVQKALLGIINQKGNFLWLLDLSLLLKNCYTLTNQINSAKVIVAQLDQNQIGLMVNQLSEIRDFVDVDHNLVDTSSITNQNYIFGFAGDDQGNIPVIDLSKIKSYLSS